MTGARVKTISYSDNTTLPTALGYASGTTPQQHARNVALSSARLYGGGTSAGGRAIYSRVESAVAGEMGAYTSSELQAASEQARRATAEAEAERLKLDRRANELTLQRLAQQQAKQTQEKIYAQKAQAAINQQQQRQHFAKQQLERHREQQHQRALREDPYYKHHVTQVASVKDEYSALDVEGRFLEKRGELDFYTEAEVAAYNKRVNAYNQQRTKLEKRSDIIQDEFKAYYRPARERAAHEKELLKQGYSPSEAGIASGRIAPEKGLGRVVQGFHVATEKLGLETRKKAEQTAATLGFKAGGGVHQYAGNIGEIAGGFAPYLFPPTQALAFGVTAGTVGEKVGEDVSQFLGFGKSKYATTLQEDIELGGRKLGSYAKRHPLETATVAGFVLLPHAGAIKGLSHGKVGKGVSKVGKGVSKVHRFQTPKTINKVVDFLPKKTVAKTLGRKTKYGSVKLGGHEVRVFKAGTYKAPPKFKTVTTAYTKVDPYSLHPHYEKVERAIQTQKLFYTQKGKFIKMGKPETKSLTSLTTRSFDPAGQVNYGKAYIYKTPKGEVVALKKVRGFEKLQEFTRLSRGDQQIIKGIRQTQDPLNLKYEEIFKLGKIRTSKKGSFGLTYDWYKPKLTKSGGKMWQTFKPKKPTTPFVSGLDEQTISITRTKSFSKVATKVAKQTAKHKGLIYSPEVQAWEKLTRSKAGAGAGLTKRVVRDAWNKPTGSIAIEFEEMNAEEGGTFLTPAEIKNPYITLPSSLQFKPKNIFSLDFSGTRFKRGHLQLPQTGLTNLNILGVETGRVSLQKQASVTVSTQAQAQAKKSLYKYKQLSATKSVLGKRDPPPVKWTPPIPPFFFGGRGVQMRDITPKVSRRRERRKTRAKPLIPLLDVFKIEARTGREVIHPRTKAARYVFSQDLAFNFLKAGKGLPYGLTAKKRSVGIMAKKRKGRKKKR